MNLPGYFTAALLIACTVAIASIALTSYVVARQRGSGRGPATSVGLAVTTLLGAWLAAVATISGSELLAAEAGVTAPPIAAALLIPLIVGIALLRTPAVRDGLTVPGTLPMLAASHFWRVGGILFILLTLQGQLPAHFAWPAGIGDVAIGLAAPLVGWAIWKRPSRRGLVVIFNTLGLLDLITAIALGVLSAPGALQVFTGAPGTGAMTLLPMVLIPAFLVPLGMLTHLAAFQALRSQSLCADPRPGHHSDHEVALQSA